MSAIIVGSGMEMRILPMASKSYWQGKGGCAVDVGLATFKREMENSSNGARNASSEGLCITRGSR